MSKNTHKLTYNLNVQSLGCNQAKEVIKHLLNKDKIDMVLYKGGIVERDFCREINIAAYNIEQLNVVKVNSHDPEEEVNLYYKQLIQNGEL